MDNFSRFGCYHTACGRVLKNRTFAALDDEAMDHPSPGIEPVRHVIEGARSYTQNRGLDDPHDGSIDYHKVQTHRGLLTDLAHAYDKLPLDDPHAHKHFHAMRNEVDDQYHHMTQNMGIKVHVLDHDPYKDVHELAHDVKNNHQIKILGTHATGGHPFFSNEENDRFRAVHDMFGHLGTGRDFDRHGEEAAYQAHSRMFSAAARPALASETRGQNGSLIVNSHFGPQRIAVLPHHLWNPNLAHKVAGARGDLPEDISFTHREPDEYSRMHRINAYSQGHEVGMMHLDSDRHNEVGWVKVHPMHVRQGIASAMWDHAQSLGLNPRHSDIQSQSGKAWSKSTPELEKVGHVATRIQAPEVRENLSEESSMQSYAQLHAIKSRWLLEDIPLGFTIEAHVSGNQIDVLHCFAGETEYVTRDGIKTLAETAGTVQTVLTQDPTTKQSYWVDAPIYNFGEQSLKKVTLRRNKLIETIHATAGHRWMVRRPDRMLTTDQLRPGHRLAFNVQGGTSFEPSVEGIRSGVVFGDGYAHSNNRMAAVTLWGEKDKQLLQYFPCVDLKDRITPNGIHGVYLGGAKNGLHADMKLIPSMDNDDAFLLGWLAGYFAADGTVSKQGQVILHSSKIEHLEAVRDIGIRLGISVYGIQSKMRQGYGEDPRLIHQMEFVGSTVPDSMFLIESHRDRFALRDYKYERLGWTVVSVEETDRVEDVYCAVVPGTETFTLNHNILSANCPFCGSGAVIGRSDGTVECGYCTCVFTVQVQPAYNGFPQSVDGMPYQWPGMPDPTMGGVMSPSTPPGTNMAPPMGSPDALAGGAPPDGPGTADAPMPPDMSSDPGDDEEDPDDDSDSGDAKPDKKDKKDKKKGDNPFAKKKSYRTVNGTPLDVDEYVAHLAIRFAKDPFKVAAKVKSARERGDL